MKRLLNKLWTGLKIAGLIGILGATRGDSISKFDTLWGKIKDYNQARVELYKENPKDTLEYSIKDKWQDVVDYSKSNFPEIIYIDDRRNKKINQHKLKDLCMNHDKVYERMEKSSDPRTIAIILGDVVEESGTKKINFNGKTLEYKVKLYEEDGETIDEGAAFWDYRNNEVNINLTNAEEDAEEVYYLGSSHYMYLSEFKDNMIKEFYNAVMSEAKAKHPIIHFFSKYSAFKKVYMEYTIKSSEDHEPMHDFAHDPKSSERIKKASKNDTLSFLDEILKNPKYNSHTFVISDAFDGRYSEFYKTLEDFGYTKERLMKMKPEERSKAAKEILDGFN